MSAAAAWIATLLAMEELLAMEPGYRESAALWSEVLRSLRQRGLTDSPLLAIGDGALGFWAALDEVFSTTRHQRCWNHRVLNVLDKLPKRLHAEVRRRRLRALAGSSDAPGVRAAPRCAVHPAARPRSTTGRCALANFPRVFTRTRPRPLVGGG